MFSTGEQATKLVVAEGRKVADSCTGPQRSELLRLCDETEILTNQLSDLIRRGQVFSFILHVLLDLQYYYFNYSPCLNRNYLDFKHLLVKSAVFLNPPLIKF